jgi:hypothetical protein
MTRKFLITTAFALCASGAALAQDHVGPPAAQCKEVAARLIKATGAKFDRWTPSGYRVFFKSPEMLFDCDSDYPDNRGLHMAWDKADFPSDAWFGEVAKAGRVVTGVDLRKLEAATRQCYRAALDSKARAAFSDLPNKMTVLCSGIGRVEGAEIVRIYKEAE